MRKEYDNRDHRTEAVFPADELPNTDSRWNDCDDCTVNQKLVGDGAAENARSPEYENRQDHGIARKKIRIRAIYFRDGLTNHCAYPSVVLQFWSEIKSHSIATTKAGIT